MGARTGGSTGLTGAGAGLGGGAGAGLLDLTAAPWVIASKSRGCGSAGRIWETQAMIWGAPKRILQPVAVVISWQLCDDEAWWKLPERDELVGVRRVS